MATARMCGIQMSRITQCSREESVIFHWVKHEGGLGFEKVESHKNWNSYRLPHHISKSSKWLDSTSKLHQGLGYSWPFKKIKNITASLQILHKVPLVDHANQELYQVENSEEWSSDLNSQNEKTTQLPSLLPPTWLLSWRRNVLQYSSFIEKHFITVF